MVSTDFRERVIAAFPAADPPVKVVSDLAREIHDDADLMASALKGHPWTVLPKQTLDARAKDIVALTVPAFIYYIPAFITAAAEDPISESATYVMYALCPLGNFSAFYEHTCALFTPKQAAVVAELLESLEKDPGFAVFKEEMKPGLVLWRRRARP
ncbi:MAG TPA: hypothetical protein VNI20_12020 [Fimbriimonadaceae bacterium]|nr:hypothetical protein [Fimbriimonadaceae bacterium]